MELIVAAIQSCKKHPDATKLNVCEVFDGTNTLQIVCGATNVRAGMKTILAPVGVTTPKGLLIKEASLRGVPSNGMLCSAKDLDISNEDGIIDLPDDMSVGVKLRDIPKDLLSSTPWHTFTLVDSLWENNQSKKLKMVKKSEELPDKNEYRLLSQTFFENNKYIYRHFKV
jgi:tRNA-binding EMAP/Myf-like protein